MHTNHAFTRVEVLMILAITGLITAVHLPMLAANRGRSDLAHCTSQYKQVGEAYRGWCDDHDGRMPYTVPKQEGGTQGLTSFFPHCQVLSNYLASPRLLTCPGSRNTPATAWNALRTQSIGFSLGAHASRGHPREMWAVEAAPSGANSTTCSLTGGAYVETYDGSFGKPGSFGNLAWNPELHEGLGNILMSDGSVMTIPSGRIATVFAMEPPVPQHKVHLLSNAVR